MQLSVEKDLNTDLMIEIALDATQANGVLNFNASGNFYKTSNKEMVSVYGLSGSFEYTGSEVDITGKNSYHNSTADK